MLVLAGAVVTGVLRATDEDEEPTAAPAVPTTTAPTVSAPPTTGPPTVPPTVTPPVVLRPEPTVVPVVPSTTAGPAATAPPLTAAPAPSTSTSVSTATTTTLARSPLGAVELPDAEIADTGGRSALGPGLLAVALGALGLRLRRRRPADQA